MGVPIRQNVRSRQPAPRSELLRLVLGPDGRAYVDVDGRAPGRGHYLEPGDLAAVVRARELGRIFRASVEWGLAPEAVVPTTLELLDRRIADLFRISRRAGALVYGQERVERALTERDERGAAAILVTALDVADRTLDHARAAAERAGVATLVHGSCAELGAMLGRDTVGVVLVEHPKLAPALEVEIARRRAVAGAKREEPRAQPGPESRTTNG